MTEHPVLTLVRSKLRDPSLPFTIIAELEAYAGQGGEVAKAITESGAIRSTRSEPGCVAYDVHRDLDSPDRFVAYEAWRNLDALREHLATPTFAAVGAAVGGLLASAPVIRVLTSVEREL